MASIQEQLKNISVAQVLRHKEQQNGNQDLNAKAPVREVLSSYNVEKSLSILIRHKINCAPILDPESNNYIGMLSMADLVSYVIAWRTATQTHIKSSHPLRDSIHGSLEVRAAGDNSLHGESDDDSHPVSPSSPSSTGSNDLHIMGTGGDAAAQKFLDIIALLKTSPSVSVGCVADISKRHPLTAIRGKDSLYHLLHDLLGTGVHRVLVVKDESQYQSNQGAVPAIAKSDVISIITQSDVIRYIASNMENWKAVTSQTIADMQLANYKKIISVSATSPVFVALQALHENQISSVAVVDADDRLLGVISVTDVQYAMVYIRRGILETHCAHFIQRIKTKQMLENYGMESYPAIQTSPNASLSQIIKLIVATQVHRIFITNNEGQKGVIGKPIGVVSLTDIMRRLSSF